MNILFYTLALIFSVLAGIAYMASFIRLTSANGFSKPFIASILRVVIGVIFLLILLSLPLLLGILMVLLCIGAAGVTLRFIQ